MPGCVIRCSKGIASNTLRSAPVPRVSNVFSAANGIGAVGVRADGGPPRGDSLASGQGAGQAAGARIASTIDPDPGAQAIQRAQQPGVEHARRRY